MPHAYWFMPERAAEHPQVSDVARELVRASDVIDLHVDTFIWTRMFGYDLRKRHGAGPFAGCLLSQVDLPRALEGGLTGAMWSITTNPWRSAGGRARTLGANVAELRRVLDQSQVARVVGTAAEYRAARAACQHAALLAVQGGNACDADESVLESGALTRVTLVHMTNSDVGATSSPFRLGPDTGLGRMGARLVERLNETRTFVDLAHISRRGFFEAVALHDQSQPLIVTHTGMSGVHASWRNLDDDQIKCIADTGGVVGVVFHGEYLSGRFLGGPMAAVAAHVAHIVNVAGEDVAALGSDWDGFIIPPRGLRSCDRLPVLVQVLLDAGLSERCVQKVLGGNFLRAFERLRPS
jgi:membrane dipeptidase